MNLERIVKFCEKKIKKEREQNPMFADPAVQAYEQVRDFILNADKPKDNEPEQVEEIFSKHYSAYILKLTGKEKKYTFNTSEKKTIKTKLIPLIKMEMANAPELFEQSSVGDFFDVFILNMEDFWKRDHFTIQSITKHFAKIYHKVYINLHGKNLNGHSYKKNEGNTLIGRDYSEKKDYTLND